jgi:hypothetical protein
MSNCCDPIIPLPNCQPRCLQQVDACCVINEDNLPCINPPLTIENVAVIKGQYTLTQDGIENLVLPEYGHILVTSAQHGVAVPIGKVGEGALVENIVGNTAYLTLPNTVTGKADITFQIVEQRQCDINKELCEVLSELVTTVDGIVDCVYDASGNCEITGIKEDIITIQGDITTIQGDIVVIQGDVTSLEVDVAALQACVLDASGNCFADEDWKEIDDVGLMANGEAIPLYNAGAAQPLSSERLSLRMRADGSVELRGNVAITDNTTSFNVFTLPVGYQPSNFSPLSLTVVVEDINNASALSPGLLSIQSNGDVYLVVDFVSNDKIVYLGPVILSLD